MGGHPPLVNTSDLPEPIVLWAMPLANARELHEFLHHYRPGGYQFDHDQLRKAIVLAEATRDSSQAKRTKAGYREVRTAEHILAQFRQCCLDAEEQKDEGYWDLVGIHNQHATDSAQDLDNLLSDNKAAPLPAEWQRG